MDERRSGNSHLHPNAFCVIRQPTVLQVTAQFLFSYGGGLACFKCSKKGHNADAGKAVEASCSGVQTAPNAFGQEGVIRGYVEMKDRSEVPVVNLVMVDEPRFLNEGMPSKRGKMRDRSPHATRGP